MSHIKGSVVLPRGVGIKTLEKMIYKVTFSDNPYDKRLLSAMSLNILKDMLPREVKGSINEFGYYQGFGWKREQFVEVILQRIENGEPVTLERVKTRVLHRLATCLTQKKQERKKAQNIYGYVKEKS